MHEVRLKPVPLSRVRHRAWTVVLLGLLGGITTACAPTTLSGVITTIGSGIAVPAITVSAYRDDVEALVASTTTNNTGSYELGLPNGSYRIKVGASEWHGGSATWAGAGTVAVGITPVSLDIAITAIATGGITGTVNNGYLPLPNVAVAAVVTANGPIAGTATTAGDGTFTITGLTPGTYQLLLYDATLMYRAEWWNTRGVTTADRAASNTVTVAAGAPTNANTSKMAGKDCDPTTFFPGAVFPWATDLVGLHLEGCELQGATISFYANAWGAFFVGADLRDADLFGMRFVNADVRGMNITGVRLLDNRFNNAVGINTVVGLTSRRSFYNCDFTDTGLDLSNADIPGMDFGDAEVPLANFSGANLTGSSHSQTDFGSTNFTGANLTDFSISSYPSAFYGTDFDGANLTNANLAGGEQYRTSYINSNIDGTNFGGASFSRATLLGATNTPIDYEYATYDDTVCPNGVNSNAVGATCVGKPWPVPPPTP